MWCSKVVGKGCRKGEERQSHFFVMMWHEKSKERGKKKVKKRTKSKIGMLVLCN